MFALICFKWPGGLHYEGFLCMIKMNRYIFNAERPMITVSGKLH